MGASRDADTESAVRVDKWLWAARFFKTRGVAQTALENGRVLIGGERIKRSRTVQLGDEIWIRVGNVERTVVVCGISANRGPAPVAQQLYEETEESVSRRTQQREKRRLFMDPASAIAAGRPTKRERRQLQDIRRRDQEHDAE